MSRVLRTWKINTVELHLSDRWLSKSPISGSAWPFG